VSEPVDAEYEVVSEPRPWDLARIREAKRALQLAEDELMTRDHPILWPLRKFGVWLLKGPLGWSVLVAAAASYWRLISGQGL